MRHRWRAAIFAVQLRNLLEERGSDGIDLAHMLLSSRAMQAGIEIDTFPGVPVQFSRIGEMRERVELADSEWVGIDVFLGEISKKRFVGSRRLTIGS